jgi:tetratricopeptide (TPR) repeat protein
LSLLERALSLDPRYALAHAYSAECYHSIFLRGGMDEEDRKASIRHAEAAISFGQDDALALSFAGFVIGMDKHDRAAAFAAFESALALSPSSAVTYIQGSVILGLAGEADQAIEWAERALRLSPFDPWRASAFFALSVAHFLRGEFQEAESSARKAIQSNPGFSIPYLNLAACLTKLGRIEEAKDIAARALELQPELSVGQLAAGANWAPALKASMGEALLLVGLPE